MTAADIARALGGHRSGDGHLVRCPVPGHGQGKADRRPSLLIRDGDSRLLVHCFAGCDPRDIVAVLRQRGLLDGDLRRSERRIAPSVPGPARQSAPPAPSSTVQRLWRAADPIAGSIAERYLVVHRGLAGPFPPSLRFAPEVFHPRLRRHLPALLAAVQAPDRQVIAVQATWLSADGRKALPDMPRWTFGTIGDGVVRLGAASERLGLAEGVEDALAVSQLSQLSQGSRPPQLSCWACLGAARMHRVRIPEIVSEIHIFADDDVAGLNAAGRTALVHQAAGRRVVLRLPPVAFKDWGEVIWRSGGRAAA